jgi:hypothetical protein
MQRLLTLANAYFATMPAIVGLSLLIYPDFMVPLVFENPPLTSTNRELVDILRLGFAIRDIYMSMTTWAAIYHGGRKMTGWCLIAGACVPVVDGLALDQALGRGLWSHWGFVPVVLSLGIRQAFF